MANFAEFFPELMKNEGGDKFTNIPGDRGGATKWGVTLATWLQAGSDKDNDGDIDVNDLKISTIEDAMKIAKKRYWDPLQADLIKSQSVAEFIMDWGYNSGIGTAAKHLQKVIGATQDGQIGAKTLALVNSINSFTLFEKLRIDRLNFFNDIVNANISQEKFIKGWRNRVNNFKFKN